MTEKQLKILGILLQICIALAFGYILGPVVIAAIKLWNTIWIEAWNWVPPV